MNEKEAVINKDTGWEYMRDLVRATIVVGNAVELWDAYKWFKDSLNINILKIKDKLTSNLRTITLSFNFDNRIIGELQLRYEPLPAQYHAQSILSELERASDPLEFI